MNDDERTALLARVKQGWITRADALELKGRRRDVALMHFLAGVRIGLGGDDHTHTPIDGLMMTASFQGSKAVEAING